MSVVLGVDGCKGGWVGAAVDENLSVTWQLFPTAAQFMSVAADVVAIDIPMGLPDAGTRACDSAARKLLPGAAASVFAAPVRAVLECTSYDEARRVLRERGGASMSAQAFGLTPRVREVEACLRGQPALRERVIEVHPELAFRRLAGRNRMARKKSAAGVGQRIVALARWLPEAAAVLAMAPRSVPVDDALDALACAYTARCYRAGRTEALGGGERDPFGLPMQIVVPLVL